MKRIYILFCLGFIFSAFSLKAQININLALANRPQPWLSDWANPANGLLLVTFMPGPVLNDPIIKFKTTILDESGAVIGATNFNAAIAYRLKDGVNQFSIADALQLQNLSLAGKAQSLLQRTGRLAAGQYQLTVEVLNGAGDIVRAKQTRPFFITAYQLPVLISPVTRAKLDANIAQSIIVFRWTSLVPGTPELPYYKIQVFEILPGQTAMQAYRGNMPILNEAVARGVTQYIWRPRLAVLDSTANNQFIWTIQTLDKNGMPIPGLDLTAQGRSDPAMFNIVKIDKKNNVKAINKLKD